jgi:hypothetical protein
MVDTKKNRKQPKRATHKTEKRWTLKKLTFSHKNYADIWPNLINRERMAPSAEEDSQLIAQYKEGLTIEQLADKHRRNNPKNTSEPKL